MHSGKTHSLHRLKSYRFTLLLATVFLIASCGGGGGGSDDEPVGGNVTPTTNPFASTENAGDDNVPDTGGPTPVTGSGPTPITGGGPTPVTGSGPTPITGSGPGSDVILVNPGPDVQVNPGPAERLVFDISSDDDVLFLVFEDVAGSTNLFIYDYLGDAFDQGPDCIQITEIPPEQAEEIGLTSNDAGQLFLLGLELPQVAESALEIAPACTDTNSGPVENGGSIPVSNGDGSASLVLDLAPFTEEGDVILLAFVEEGDSFVAFQYDFLGDSFDQGAECFAINEVDLFDVPLVIDETTGQVFIDDVEVQAVDPAVLDQFPDCNDIDAPIGGGSMPVSGGNDSAALVLDLAPFTEEGDIILLAFFEESDSFIALQYDFLGDSFDQGAECFFISELDTSNISLDVDDNTGQVFLNGVEVQVLDPAILNDFPDCSELINAKSQKNLPSFMAMSDVRSNLKALSTKRSALSKH